jgi:pyruvate/2-oxoglutarate dehydrogenase complex dihydrolipoamide dehydrogenase (E3) component
VAFDYDLLVIGRFDETVTAVEKHRTGAVTHSPAAACDAFGVAVHGMDRTLPIGIYTIPEISFVGRTEEQLTEAAVPYRVPRNSCTAASW